MSLDRSSVRMGGVPFAPTPLPKKTKHERGRAGERGPTVQIRPAHNDSSLHTFRLYQHLHIQKYSAIFPGRLSVRVCMRARALARFLCAACGSNVSDGTTTAQLCVVCVKRAAHSRLWRRTGTARLVWPPRSNTAEFVFDYCTRLIFWQRTAWA